MQFGRHISGQFNHDLEHIQTQALAMGGLVELQLSQVFLGLQRYDIEIANQVIMTEHQVYTLAISIDEACARIIAKRQPAAKDLRLVLAIIKIIMELKRVGEAARKIAQIVIDNDDFNQTAKSKLNVSFNTLGQQAITLLHHVLDDFARMDAATAQARHHGNELLTQESVIVIEQLTKYMMNNPQDIPKVMPLIWAARAIERVGERCQNISEYIIYSVNGKMYDR